MHKLPLEKFYHWEATIPNKIYFHQPKDGQMIEYTWEYVGQQVRKMAAYLKLLNYPAGSNIALISKNCAHWIMADLAIWMSGHVSVPLYPNLTAETIKQILVHSDSVLLFVGKLDGWQAMRPGVPQGMPCITFPYGTTDEFPQWDDVIAKQEPLKESPTRTHDEIATIIYTSGTTGMPKGVVHKFKAISFVISNYLQILPMAPSERFFSYLPLSHVAERLLVECGSLYSGGSVAFAESLDLFAKNLQAAAPTVFLGVPRIWTKFQLGVLGKMPQKKLDKLLSLPIISTIVKRKIKKALGLHQVRIAITGAAPMPSSLLQWFAKLDIEILESFSMTENFAYSHATMPNGRKIGYVGKAMPHVQVKLTDAGELLVKSESLMDCYYKEPEMTKETITDGYLHTGDKCEVDAEGYLKITGRVKDLFKTSKGKYVAPSPIEMRFAEGTNIEQVCLVGVGLPQPIALVVLSEIGKSKSQETVTAELIELMNKVNPTLDSHERIKQMIVVKEVWSPENSLLTPTMKIKRHVVESKYHTQIENWYKNKAEVVFE